jgi:hypothetical protein
MCMVMRDAVEAAVEAASAAAAAAPPVQPPIWNVTSQHVTSSDESPTPP